MKANRVSIKWNKEKVANGYEIYIYTKGKWVLKGKTTANKYTITYEYMDGSPYATDEYTIEDSLCSFKYSKEHLKFKS